MGWARPRCADEAAQQDADAGLPMPASRCPASRMDVAGPRRPCNFLAGFIRPDLPLLLRWRAGACVQAAVVDDIAGARPVAQRA
jgi:hypothetical protein